MNDNFYPKYKDKTLLSIDYGTKVCGMAVFEVGVDFTPYPAGKIIKLENKQKINEILHTIKSLRIDIVILGIPNLLDGQESTMTKKVKFFAKLLKEKLNDIPLYIQDETLSSFEAEERMKNSPQYGFKVNPKKIDELAACVILEDFLKTENPTLFDG